MHQTRITSDVVFGLEQVRDDLLAQVLPGLRVAEEAGDVDQDGVEELGELVRLRLQERQVVLEALDPDLLHPV